ncbi:ABC transporter ATP-binding protein [Utexia brackfieldae]|uniref:ABC transporter ATP-binding protein n=1 Tax=Utexia brackfieldae TaxID=3074108 RepID=UPI00370D5E92
MFVTEDMSYRIDQRTILNPTSVTLETGKVYGIIGHNGSGKSTFAKLLAHQLIPSAGQIEIDQTALSAFSSKDLAKVISYLPQYLPSDIHLTVEELVKLGRFAWKGLTKKYDQQDQAIITQSLEQTDTLQFKTQLLSGLSGGERQRVWLAMCLAQKSQYLILDEPLSALDINHQIEVMRLLQQLAHQYQLTIVVVIHDINLASEFCDQILAFKQGQLIYNLPAHELIQPAILQDIYDMPFSIVAHPQRKYQVALP